MKLSSLLSLLPGARRSSPQPLKPRTPISGWLEVERLGLKWRLEMASCISQEMVNHGEWEPLTTALIREFVKPGMHVLDVGANFGYYTLLMAQQVGETGRVWAFEPVEGYRRQLQRNAELNNLLSRIQIVPCALSDRVHVAEIDVTNATASLHSANPKASIAREQISLKPLDAVMDELAIPRVDFIKVDVDGHEPFFLRGGAQTLRRFRPPMAMEFAQHCLHVAGSDVREQARLLRDLGYEICSESTRTPYATEMQFLTECGNFDHSGNVLVIAPDESKR